MNDAEEQAHRSRGTRDGLSAKVNLIPYNTVEGLEWSRPSRNRQEHFLPHPARPRIVVATLRREKGHDIAPPAASCACRRQATRKMGCLRRRSAHQAAYGWCPPRTQNFFALPRKLA